MCAVQLMKTNRTTRPRLSLSFVLIGVLCLLLPVLAFLQYRWIGQVSAAEHERLEEGLDNAARRFVEDIIREFSDVASNFQFQATTETDSLEAQLFRSLEPGIASPPTPTSYGRSLFPNLNREATWSSVDSIRRSGPWTLWSGRSRWMA